MPQREILPHHKYLITDRMESHHRLRGRVRGRCLSPQALISLYHLIYLGYCCINPYFGGVVTGQSHEEPSDPNTHPELWFWVSETPSVAPLQPSHEPNQQKQQQQQQQQQQRKQRTGATSYNTPNLNQSDNIIPLCEDLRRQCRLWAAAGMCDVKDNDIDSSNVRFVQAHCPRSCQMCYLRVQTVSQKMFAFGQRPAPTNRHRRKPGTAGIMVIDVIGADLGVPQRVPEHIAPSERKSMVQLLEHVRATYRGSWKVDAAADLDHGPIRKCRNLHEYCALFAVQGGCNAQVQVDGMVVGVDWMQLHCAPVCFACHDFVETTSIADGTQDSSRIGKASNSTATTFPHWKLDKVAKSLEHFLS